MRSILILLCTLGIVTSVTGQVTPEKIKLHGFEKKIAWGMAYQQCWSTIRGTFLPEDYFTKPSLGFFISAPLWNYPNRLCR